MDTSIACRAYTERGQIEQKKCIFMLLQQLYAEVQT